MAHIHTNPGEHDLTASAFILDVSEQEPRIWLHKHKLLGKWLQFGGHVELQENPWQAVSHEVVEESGFAMSQLQLLQPRVRLRLLDTAHTIPQPVVINSHPFDGGNHNHTDIAFAFTTDTSPASRVGERESEALKLFTQQEIRSAEPSLIMPNVRRICLFVMKDILENWEQVDPSEFNR